MIGIMILGSLVVRVGLLSSENIYCFPSKDLMTATAIVLNLC
jgi:hypothetical protein